MFILPWNRLGNWLNLRGRSNKSNSMSFSEIQPLGLVFYFPARRLFPSGLKDESGRCITNNLEPQPIFCWFNPNNPLKAPAEDGITFQTLLNP